VRRYTDKDDPINPITGNGALTIGLTKREYFAAIALQGILAGTSGQESLAHVHPSSWTISAIQAADALIEQLNKEGE